MLMKSQPLHEAIMAAREAAPAPPCVIALTPQGRVFDQSAARQKAASLQPLIFVAGRYEGMDERLIQIDVDEEWSLGDFVMSGGELPAMAMMDAMIRLLPGALGHQLSAEEDSFVSGLLDCPHYTRPEVFKGLEVPGVLRSGNHEAIRRWRLMQSLGRTWLRRPDLLSSLELDVEQQGLLDTFKSAYEAEYTCSEENDERQASDHSANRK
jgi:tRNA (guanine37-N1)-methyltransferase